MDLHNFHETYIRTLISVTFFPPDKTDNLEHFTCPHAFQVSSTISRNKTIAAGHENEIGPMSCLTFDGFALYHAGALIVCYSANWHYSFIRPRLYHLSDTVVLMRVIFQDARMEWIRPVLYMPHPRVETFLNIVASDLFFSFEIFEISFTHVQRRWANLTLSEVSSVRRWISLRSYLDKSQRPHIKCTHVEDNVDLMSQIAGMLPDGLLDIMLDKLLLMGR